MNWGSYTLPPDALRFFLPTSQYYVHRDLQSMSATSYGSFKGDKNSGWEQEYNRNNEDEECAVQFHTKPFCDFASFALIRTSQRMGILMLGKTRDLIRGQSPVFVNPLVEDQSQSTVRLENNSNTKIDSKSRNLLFARETSRYPSIFLEQLLHNPYHLTSS